MGTAIQPRSIRGKLILVFLIAICPALCIQVCEKVDAYLRAENLSARHRADMARAIANAVSAHISQLENRHERICRQIALEDSGGGARYVEKISSALADGTCMWVVPTDNADQMLMPGKTGKTLTCTDGKSLKLHTQVKFRDGKSGKVVTAIGHNVLAGHCPNARSACKWRLCGIREYGTHSAGATAAILGTDWKIALTKAADMPVEPLFSERIWLVGSTLASIMGLLIVFLMGNRLARPVARLAHAATAMAAGDFRKRVKVSTGDELESLGTAFNSLGMSLTLREMTLKRQTLMLTGMVEAARVASSSLDVKKCGKAIAKAVCVHLEAADAVVFKKNNVDGGLKIIGLHGQRPGSTWKRLASHAAESGGYLVMTEQAPDGGAAVLAGVPLISGSGTIGAIVARFEGGNGRDDLKVGSIRADLLITFGIHAAAAIANAEVYSQTEKYSEVLEDWVEHLSSVMEVTNAISPSLNIDEALNALAKATSVVMGTDECAIYIPDRDGVLRIRSCCKQNTVLSALNIRIGESVSGRAFAERRYAACNDTSKSFDMMIRMMAESHGFHAILSAPLIVENQALGTISVYNKDPHNFSPREIRLLTSIALHAAIIIRNAGMYTRESSIAERLQNSLISEAPESCKGLRFAGRYIPALDEARIGGDFYDVSVLPDGTVGVVIGDVSGKGLKAAIHLAACKHMLRAMMFAHPNDPARALSRLNSAINHFFDLSFFVTVFCGIIDPKQQTMVYANAGHPPALLISQEGKIQRLLASMGVPVGSGQQCDYDMVRVNFEPSDMLLLYTDGVTDATVAGEPLGVDGVQKIVFDAGDCSPSEMIDRICSRLCGADGYAAKDDIAMLAIAHVDAANEREEIIGGRSEQTLAGHAAHHA
ncbi:MAG: SpoIIE family protein phosphatase [Armatimonadota bacterium]|nr:SpoIIE family protein phosphatase [bacterium]